MAFRDHLAGAYTPAEPISCIHGLFDLSKERGHDMIHAEILEAVGHTAALNVLSRERLCQVFDVTPGELIDVLGSAMENPQQPKFVTTGPIFENEMGNVALTKLPIPHHYREDWSRGKTAKLWNSKGGKSQPYPQWKQINGIRSR